MSSFRACVLYITTWPRQCTESSMQEKLHKCLVNKQWAPYWPRDYFFPPPSFFHLLHCSCFCSVTKSCLTLYDPIHYSPPGSFVHRILQAKILEWIATSFSMGVFQTQGSNTCLLFWQADSLPLSHLQSLSSPLNAHYLSIFSFSGCRSHNKKYSRRELELTTKHRATEASVSLRIGWARLCRGKQQTPNLSSLKWWKFIASSLYWYKVWRQRWGALFHVGSHQPPHSQQTLQGIHSTGEWWGWICHPDITLWQIDGESGSSDRFYFLGLQNHCRQWLQLWN